MPGGDRVQIDGIRKAEVKGGGQPEFLAYANAQRPAVNEHGAVALLGPLKHRLDRFVLDGIAVHGGEQASHADVQERCGLPIARVHHGESQEAVGVRADGSGHRLVIAGKTRDERSALDAVAIEIASPSLGEGGRIGGGKLPVERCPHAIEGQAGFLCGQ